MDRKRYTRNKYTNGGVSSEILEDTGGLNLTASKKEYLCLRSACGVLILYCTIQHGIYAVFVTQ